MPTYLDCDFPSTPDYTSSIAETEFSDWYSLTTQLETGDSASANPCLWDPVSAAYAIDTSTTVTIYDKSSMHWGLKGEWVRCRARPSVGGNILEVISSGHVWHIMELSADLGSGSSVSATVTIKGIANTVTVYDKIIASGHELVSGTSVYVFYNREIEQWCVLGVRFISEEPITDLQVDGANRLIQIKTRPLAIMTQKDKSEWTTVHTGTPC